jgi:hypothetical protein
MEEGGVWQYDIASGRWTDISPPLNRAYAGITVDPGNQQRMIVSTISHYQMRGGIGDQFYETLDGGKRWNSIVANGVQIDSNGVSWIAGSFIHWTASIEFDPFDTRRLMAVSGNGVFVSTDIHAPSRCGSLRTWAGRVRAAESGQHSRRPGDFRHRRLRRLPPHRRHAVLADPHADHGHHLGLDFAALNPNVVARAGSAMYLSHDMGISWKKTATCAASGPGGAERGRQGDRALPGKRPAIAAPTRAAHGARCRACTPSAAAPWPIRSIRANSTRWPGDRLLVSTDGGASFAPTAAVLASAKGSKAVRAVPGREGDVGGAV